MASKASATQAKKPQGLSLHIGINEVSAAHYEGWTGPLAACEFDAHDMAALAQSRGMKSTLLITKKATRANLLAALRKAAKTLVAGDYFFMSFSGHGGQVPDVSGEEDDKQDETWCLFDGQLIDDELYYELSKFKSGVRIFVVSDSCHSGTVVRAARPPPGTPAQRPRIMPPAVGMRVYAAHQSFYDQLQNEVARHAGGRVTDPDTALAKLTVSTRLTGIVKAFHPSLILISGCQDNQFSMDGDHNGAFTEQLLRVWNNGAFKGSYASLHAHIRAGLPPSQSPNLFTLGPAAPFLKQAPFSV
ncbi:caspase family protein [Hydrogenophaga sp.]|uniref:caspase family protein n=1 Tax=Hydrogenophaga sp. TaxID=1904254 RepID=UPI002731D724|nr:caspase family protein [Hydrogenophaga sp.]MDP2074719.1 caspase family protein [Hydrogenophaga sp.]MDP3107859.1 caspase family protein [Hydrogenophaga sp.]MDZ4279954.1 caspase family protein [Hydrogenophaga sp.]